MAGNFIINNANGNTVTLQNPDTNTEDLVIDLSSVGDRSVPTPYHIYNGSVEATNTVVTNGFSITLYTGNGGTQAINTGVDMSTQWGNDASETFGGLSWIKSRSAATNHYFVDTVRGATKDIYSNATTAETTEATGLTAFTSTGFTLGSLAGLNTNLATYTSGNFQTTHRISGVTNHEKPYTCHYNPYTGFTIVKYEGSGIAGHEIPHYLGRKLGFVTIKQTNVVNGWIAQYKDESYLILNTTAGDVVANNGAFAENSMVMANSNSTNASGGTFIMYGWANSYYDADNTLIGNYEIGVYQGTGSAGNKVPTRGKPAWVMIKRLDNVSSWGVIDNQRITELFANESTTETTTNFTHPTFSNDGITFLGTAANDLNNSGGQYLYMVVYDNDSGSGKSKYPKATDTTNLSINALVPYANGIDINGEKVSISYKNETITGLTLAQGKNYPYSKNDGTYGLNKYEPMYGKLRDRVIAGENPDYFDLETRKWYGTSGGSELITNGTFDTNTTGWTANGTTISSINGTIRVTQSGVYAYAYQGIPTVIGKTYTVLVDCIAGTYTNPYCFVSSTVNPSGSASVYDNSLGVSYDDVTYTGKKSFKFVAQTITSYIYIGIPTAVTGSLNVYFDNISVFETVPTIGAEITPRTYLDCIVYADQNGQVEYVEELPKIEYIDIIKANEYQGKNACTAWVNFDGTTTPPTIRDSYNVFSIIRISNYRFDVYHTLDNNNYSISTSNDASNGAVSYFLGEAKLSRVVGKTTLDFRAYNGAADATSLLTNACVQIFGGKD